MNQLQPGTFPADASRDAGKPERPRRPYTPPAIIAVNRLETRAGTPITPTNLDPMNIPNQYGL